MFMYTTEKLSSDLKNLSECPDSELCLFLSYEKHTTKFVCTNAYNEISTIFSIIKYVCDFVLILCDNSK